MASSPSIPSAAGTTANPRTAGHARTSGAATAGAGGRPAASALVVPGTDGVPLVPGQRRQVVSTGLAARLAERDAQRRRRWWVRGAWVAAGFVVLGALVWGVFFSPLFALDADEVVISGEGTVIEPGDVVAVVDGVVDVPLPRLDTVALRGRILDVPGVRDARLTRDWPRGLTVELVSREPVAAVPQGGGVVLLDDEGVQVGRADAAPEGLPTMTFDIAAEGRRTLESALILLNALPEGLAAEIATISAESPDDVRMTLRGGATILWGGKSDAALKVRVVEVLRSAKKTKSSKVFDVSAPTAPITR
ncbi:cell division protein FtsQ/DivIB [Flavimobilis sp. GY10621]|uniref:Cell division protein FtsQ/DivIB n=1 Tax=Flavimobilis rhizosphaerae TaxID=2775421 RepID=A0ABR9DRH0_9MICO|nr:cell division protein FtsQ/DivIB [Flavimobilis rhizosphaerae]MBD9699711.1 cell division protein FtsQ/DivIB [Flavimobilis rhizosphaerae]